MDSVSNSTPSQILGRNPGTAGIGIDIAVPAIKVAVAEALARLWESTVFHGGRCVRLGLPGTNSLRSIC
ncbi:hypothetical protein M501DRAFT_994682 [Patellaria atrata CBS 101060]|uniref:Uncharacterized protein n=1 Tax=Patellaria atrata CBS 101060 TaxID=1346257 RepID=A0A9P4SIP7_9PEZI|nr:hypothetical protein M501DRAFT_994682 [Patellaria atrata CBS 101060]